jgi:uncharacterized protein (TIGR02996 family)
VTADELCTWLREGPESQREKLEAIERDHLATIRALYNDDYDLVMRELKKRLSSPKLATRRAAVLAALVPHPHNPRPQAAPAPRPVDVLPPATGDQETQLAAAILANPLARESYIVFGDWLESRGDPRGQLVTIGQELAKNPGHKAMRAAHAAQLAAHGGEILGGLADCLEVVTEIEWFMGFIRSARVGLARDRKPAPPIEDVLGWLLDEPGPGRFLQELTLGIIRRDANNSGTTLWPMVPDLRELTLRGGRMTIGAIDLPKLETLTTITGGLDHASLAYIAAADWPELHTLALHVGLSSEGAACDAAALAPLLEGTNVPKLRSLGIVNCEFVDALLERLAASPLLPRLAALDVAMGTMSADGVATIVRHADRFAHLALTVDDNYLPEATREPLAACVRTLSFGDQRSDRGDPANRYAAMYE